MDETNWAGNVTYETDGIHRPTSLGEARELISSSERVRVIGSRHSFTRIADSPVMLDATSLPEFLEIGADRSSVRVNGSMTYGRLAELLTPLRLTTTNFASLPHISIAGAVATATHGSGDTNANLGSAVQAVQLITGAGEMVEFARGDEGFEGAVVSLGALGLVTAVALDVVPTFEVAQTVYDGLTIEDVAANFDAIFSAAYSVSVFTTWRPGDQDRNQLYLKARSDQTMSAASEALVSALTPAAEPRHPIKEMDAEGCTEQFGVPGAPIDRLPHFKLEFRPSTGDEIQSEFFVPREHAAEAIGAMFSISEDLAEAMMIAEIRTIAADTQWMSPHRDRDSVAFHFTWHPDQAKAEAAARLIGKTLKPFDVRPHWGKVFDSTQFDFGSYLGRADFLALVDQLDPTGTFTNDWFNTVVR